MDIRENYKNLLQDVTLLLETDRGGDIEYARYGNAAAPKRQATTGLLPDKLDDNFFKLFGTSTGVKMGQVAYVGVKLSEVEGKPSEMFFFDSNFGPASYAEIKNKGLRVLVISEDGRMGEMKDGKFVSLVKEAFNIQAKRNLMDSVYEKVRSGKGLDPRHISVIYFFVRNETNA